MESTTTTDNLQSLPKKNTDSKLLSEIVFYRTYAKTLPTGRKEVYSETVDRVENMHIRKFPQYAFEIHQAMNQVRKKLVVPSMRSMQYAGRPIEQANTRMYNCSFTNITCFRDFSDILYLLCCGVGCGFSVQKRHISQLPIITPGHPETFQIPDTKEGWAESVYKLLTNPDVKFDYKLVRPRGAPLSTGGTASGPETLEVMHEALRKIIKGATGRRLKPIEVHDLLCMIGDLIVSGGSRRSAMISLFDIDDEEMMDCKKGWDWFNTHPHRARANNSAVLLRSSPNFLENLVHVLKRCFANGTGEPGIFLTNDPDYGTNPCAEISLKSKQMCNLTEVNVAACHAREEFLSAVEAATVIGTLQATYTDFSFIQPEWKQNCDEEALLGVSLTGTAQNWPLLSSDGGALLEEAAQRALETNERWAKMLGIRCACRIGAVKPSGTTSALLGTTSGIHAAHAEYYLRRVRIETNSPLTAYLLRILDRVRRTERRAKLAKEGKTDTEEEKELVIDPATTPVSLIADLADQCEQTMGLPLLETDVYSRQKIQMQLKEEEEAKKRGENTSGAATSAAASVPASLVLTMPISMEGAIVRTKESAVELLNRAAFIHTHYIQKSHRSGPNFHNVSLTVNYLQRQTHMEEDPETHTQKEIVDHPGEEEAILEWITTHYNCFAGISLFPDSSAASSKYPQLPFEEIDQQTYKKWRNCWSKLGMIVKQEHLVQLDTPESETAGKNEKEGESSLATPMPASRMKKEKKETTDAPVEQPKETNNTDNTTTQDNTASEFSPQTPPSTPKNSLRNALPQTPMHKGSPSNYPAPSFSPEISSHLLTQVEEELELSHSASRDRHAQNSPQVMLMDHAGNRVLTPDPIDENTEEDEDPLDLLVAGMAQVEWDPNAVDKRKEILACAGGNCEYV